MDKPINQTINIDEVPKVPLVHQLQESYNLYSRKAILIIVAIVVAGGLSGFLLSNFRRSEITTSSSGQKTEGKSAKMVVGSTDTKTFPDSAEGTLETNGVDGEGTHRLIRPGGESQTVYLTSSVLDLNQFVGKKVRVWGQTYAAKKAGWLMDVGKVEVL